MIPVSPVQKGSLLISEPFMSDPDFKRSVVLLTEHSEEGSVGYVLNQKSNLLVKDLLPDFKHCDFPVYIGGPVANDTLHYVHSAFDRLKSGDLIAKGLYWGGNFETLKILINTNQIKSEEIKFFVGYSGWEAGQLQEELAQQSWIISNKYQQGLIFENEVAHLWKEVVTAIGTRFAHLAHYPENPMWN